MSTTRARVRQAQLSQLLLTELRMFLREPFAVGFTLVFPTMLLLLFGSAFGSQDAGGGFVETDLQVPAGIAIITAYLGIMGVPIVMAEYREMGVLERLQCTPVRLRTFFSAHVGVQMAMVAIGGLLCAAVTRVAFGLRFGGVVPIVLGVAAVGALALFALGFAVASVVRSSRTAQAVGAALYFPMIFASGATVPRSQFPDWLAALAEVIPLTWLVDLLHTTWVGDAWTAGDFGHLGLLAGSAAAALALAKARFQLG